MTSSNARVTIEPLAVRRYHLRLTFQFDVALGHGHIGYVVQVSNTVSDGATNAQKRRVVDRRKEAGTPRAPFTAAHG